MTIENSPWMCHVCDQYSVIGEGITCSECYKLTCREHITTATVFNDQSGLYELKMVCVACQFIKNLNK